MKKFNPSLAPVIWIIISLSAGFIGSQFSPDHWYEALNKPTWNPPNYIFGPVWTMLYILMGISAWLVWRKYKLSGASIAFVFFFFQLILNTLWSYLFFGLHRPDLAFMEIIVLWIAILVTLISFYKLHKTAALLLLPYLGWVTFAAVLNFTLWQLNG
ncbi:MAG: tryptophan-rich sensory protein [Calditrichia bacterium]